MKGKRGKLDQSTDKAELNSLYAEVADLRTALVYEVQRADDNWSSCERIKRKFEEAAAEREQLRADLKEAVEALRGFCFTVTTSKAGLVAGQRASAVLMKHVYDPPPSSNRPPIDDLDKAPCLGIDPRSES